MRAITLPLLLSALLWAAAPAQAAPGYSVRALKIDVTVGPANDVRCTVDADLYKPDSASASRPAPAILATNGFGGDKAGLATIARSYAERGYVFLAYSGLGFGSSGCKIYLDDPDWDGKAGSQLVSFLGRLGFVRRDRVAHDRRRYRHDPRVGMLNGSYGGQIQFAVAGRDPRVDAIAPSQTWNDLSYALAPNNTDLTTGVTYGTAGVLKADWTAAFFAAGLAGLRKVEPSRLGQCPNYADQVCAAAAQALAAGHADADTLALLRHASVSSYISRIKIPVLLAQGQHDTLFNLQESVATYRALRAQGTPVRMLWVSAGHSGGGLGTSEYDPAKPEAAYQSRMELEWFDWYLKGVGQRPRLDFSFFRHWVPFEGDAAPAVASAPSYLAARHRSLHLSGTDTLVSSKADVRAGEAQMVAAPAPTSSGGGIADAGSIDSPATSVSYTTAPLARDTDVVGIPELTVHLNAPTFAETQALGPKGKLVLFAKIQDVDPSGNVVLPANLVSAVRVADVTKPVHVELPGIVRRFARGHRIRLTLATSDIAYRGNDKGGPVGIPVGAHAPGALRLPILGAR